MVIKDEQQYTEYCDILETLAFQKRKTKEINEEIDLLTLLIEAYDNKYNSFEGIEPIPFLLSLMEEHDIKQKDLAQYLDVSKSYVSDMLHYRKGLSKIMTRKLAKRFRVKQEAFNRPYQLKKSISVGTRARKKTNNIVRERKLAF